MWNLQYKSDDIVQAGFIVQCPKELAKKLQARYTRPTIGYVPRNDVEKRKDKWREATPIKGVMRYNAVFPVKSMIHFRDV